MSLGTNEMTLSITCGQDVNVTLEPYYYSQPHNSGQYYSYSMEGYCYNGYGNIPVLPKGLTFDTQTSILSGNVSSTNVTPELNAGTFLVTVWDFSYCCWFTYVDISYTS
jgi:hypothetical protein